MCHQFVSPRFRVLHSPACLLHLHSPSPCPHPTKMLKVVRRMRCGFEMQTSGPRDDVTGRHKAQAEDKYIAPQKGSTGIDNPGLNLASHLQRYGFFALLTFKSLHLVCPLCQQSKAADTCHAFCLDGLWFAKCACFLHLLVNVMRQCLHGRQQGRGSRASGRCSLDCDIFLIRFLDLFSSPIILSLFGGGKGEYVPDLGFPGYFPQMHHQGFLQ